jgi:hypothetical protein
MAGKYKPKKLIVEGEQDKRVIPQLIEANGIQWGETRETAIVYIESYGSDQFIDESIISTELKESGLTTLGLIIDADSDLSARWASIKNACSRSIANLPEEIPESGLICFTDAGIKFGVWIMPDNKAQGMLETFLMYLIPDENESIWQYAQETAKEAKNKGAAFIDAHHDKACIYTWLAWQDPPGRQLHNAIMERILDPTHAKAQTFVGWFRQLYDL